ncbi:hypothetical protein KCU78_g1471, partial [Aureobasidium melanogenum]
MASSPSVTESLGIWEVKKVTQILSNTTDMIQVTAATEDDIDTDAASKSSKPFQALIHKSLLCFFSQYYRAALQGGFLEAGRKSVVLELDIEDCQYFVGWLYSGQLPDVPMPGHLFELYIFADKTDVLALRRAIMTKIIRMEHKMMPTFHEIAVALDSLPSTSPLYRWLLDTCVHHWVSKYPIAVTLPNGFLVDWIKGAADRTCTTTEGYCSECPCCEQNSCNYHEHESVEEWTSTCGVSKETQAKLPDHSYLVNEPSPKIDGI